MPDISEICDQLKAGKIPLTQAIYWLQIHAQNSDSPDKAIGTGGNGKL